MPRLVSVDFLRGVAAGAVVLCHAYYDHPLEPAASLPLLVLDDVLTLGTTGVWLFFVISGFCIHLRHARHAASGSERSVDFVQFWKRRLVRLYPTYIIFLLLYIVIKYYYGLLTINLFFYYNLIAHLAMFHNVDIRTAHAFSDVLWTLAIEEQLYLAYFLLLVLRRRLGWSRTLVVCFGVRVISYLLYMLIKRRFGIDFPVRGYVTSQWIVWALGALAVEAYVGLVCLPKSARDLKLGISILAFTALLIIFDRHHPDSLISKPFWFTLDLLLGTGFFVCLNALVHRECSAQSGDAAWGIMPLFGRIGIFSYSLYLSHQMILSDFSPTIAHWLHLRHGTLFLLGLAPFCLPFAWLCFHIVEKPFLHWSAAIPLTRTTMPGFDPVESAVGPVGSELRVGRFLSDP